MKFRRNAARPRSGWTPWHLVIRYAFREYRHYRCYARFRLARLSR